MIVYFEVVLSIEVVRYCCVHKQNGYFTWQTPPAGLLLCWLCKLGCVRTWWVGYDTPTYNVSLAACRGQVLGNHASEKKCGRLFLHRIPTPAIYAAHCVLWPNKRLELEAFTRYDNTTSHCRMNTSSDMHTRTLCGMILLILYCYISWWGWDLGADDFQTKGIIIRATAQFVRVSTLRKCNHTQPNGWDTPPHTGEYNLDPVRVPLYFRRCTLRPVGSRGSRYKQQYVRCV